MVVVDRRAGLEVGLEEVPADDLVEVLPWEGRVGLDTEGPLGVLQTAATLDQSWR